MPPAFANDFADAQSLRVAPGSGALQVDRAHAVMRREPSPPPMPPTLLTNVTDAELVARLALGEERALGELYDRHSAVAYGLARAIMRDAADAEEVVADCFAQMWRTAATFDPARGSVAAWV